MIKALNNEERSLALLGLVVMLICAVFSNGRFHADEHFQILEFAHYKMGKMSADDLPWEFEERMRPALQVGLGFGVIHFLSWCGLTSPFDQVMVLRILSGLLSWMLLVQCYRLFKEEGTHKGEDFWLLAILLFSWFVPLLSVRYSSENWSAISFFMAVTCMIQFEKRLIKRIIWLEILVGILLGFAFYFRFQMAFAMLGLMAWWIWRKQLMSWTSLCIIVGVCFSFLFCSLVDRWFYGTWVFTPFQYFRANILEHKAADFGVSPWWYYFTIYLEKGIPPLSILSFVFLIIGIVLNRSSVLVWIFISFLIGHLMVGHKELRFLFPMMIPFLVLIARGIHWGQHQIKTNQWLRWGKSTVVVFNCMILLGVIFSPAQPSVNMYKYLYDHANANKALMLSLKQGPYDCGILNIHFYRADSLQTLVFNSDSALLQYIEQEEPKTFWMLSENIITESKYPAYESRQLYSTIPSWIAKFDFNGWVSRSGIWILYEFQKKE